MEIINFENQDIQTIDNIAMQAGYIAGESRKRFESGY